MRWLSASVLLLCGCGQAAAPRTKAIVPLDQVPGVVMKAAKEKRPDINFDSALKTVDGIYEVRGKTAKGKILEVEVSAEGKVLLVE